MDFDGFEEYFKALEEHAKIKLENVDWVELISVYHDGHKRYWETFSVYRSGSISFKRTHARRSLDEQWELNNESIQGKFQEMLSIIKKCIPFLDKRYVSPVDEGYILRLRNKAWFYNQWEYCYPLNGTDVKEAHLSEIVSFMQSLVPEDQKQLKTF